jgi:hypothetical protein
MELSEAKLRVKNQNLRDLASLRYSHFYQNFWCVKVGETTVLCFALLFYRFRLNIIEFKHSKTIMVVCSNMHFFTRLADKRIHAYENR